MAYDEGLAERVRDVIGARRGVEEQRMFGGLSFLLNGHMCCGVLDDRLVLRLGDEAARDALENEHAAPMDFTGRPMKSMVYLSAAGVDDDAALRSWIERAVDFVSALTPKGR